MKRFALASVTLVLPVLAAAQGAAPPTYAPPEADRRAIQAVVDSALQFITDGNAIGLTDLMVSEAQVYSIRTREGRLAYAMRTRAADRERTGGAPVVERGFDTRIMLAGGMAMAWVPYDIYVNNAWSHCGVDVFVMLRVGSGWRIANLTYSVEQPPACRPHPDGPPKGMKGP